MNDKLRKMIDDMLVKNGLTETWKEAVKAEIPDGQAVPRFRREEESGRTNE